MRSFRTSQEGTSLVELLIAVGILSMIGYASTTFFKKVDTADSSARAQKRAGDEIDGVKDVLMRDFKLRDISAATSGVCNGGGAQCDGFSVDRKVKNGSDYVNMTIAYSSECRDTSMAPLTQSSSTFAFSQTNIDKLKNVTNNKPICTRTTTACGLGKYPAIRIVVPNTPGTKPSYPQLKSGTALVPNLEGSNNKTSLRGSLIGLTLCAFSQPTESSDKIVIEGIYVDAEGQLKLESRNVLVPRNNVAKIQILPE